MDQEEILKTQIQAKNLRHSQVWVNLIVMRGNFMPFITIFWLILLISQKIATINVGGFKISACLKKEHSKMGI
jgi:hypothetical protein